MTLGLTILRGKSLMPKAASIVFGFMGTGEHIQQQWHKTSPWADVCFVELDRLHSALNLAGGFGMCAKGRDACLV